MTVSQDDRTAILELVYRYTRACDLGATFDEVMTLFTEDIVLQGSLMGEYQGTEGVRTWVAECDEARSRLTMMHVVSNAIVEAVDDGARVSAYLTELMIHPSAVIGRSDQVTELAFAGLYTFDVRRAGDDWRISRRTVRVVAHDDELPRFDDPGTWSPGASYRRPG